MGVSQPGCSEAFGQHLVTPVVPRPSPRETFAPISFQQVLRGHNTEALHGSRFGEVVVRDSGLIAIPDGRVGGGHDFHPGLVELVLNILVQVRLTLSPAPLPTKKSFSRGFFPGIGLGLIQQSSKF